MTIKDYMKRAYDNADKARGDLVNASRHTFNGVLFPAALAVNATLDSVEAGAKAAKDAWVNRKRVATAEDLGI